MKHLPILSILFGILLLALFAQVTIHLPTTTTSTPITGQSLAVIIVGYCLANYKGALAIALYVILGVLGLPIFADQASGIASLTGGTGGYLIGFIIAGIFLGYSRSQEVGKSIPGALLCAIIATAIILLFGVAKLSFTYGLSQALDYGFYPFWLGGLLKAILSAIVIYFWEHYSSTIKPISTNQNQEP